MWCDETKEKIVRNLTDAGCKQQEIEDFLSALAQGDKCGAMKILTAHRQDLLDQFHKSKDCIDCLDYLVFQMRQEQDKGRSGT